MNLAALLRVFTRDLYEFDLYDLFLERISRTNRGIPVHSIFCKSSRCPKLDGYAISRHFDLFWGTVIKNRFSVCREFSKLNRSWNFHFFQPIFYKLQVFIQYACVWYVLGCGARGEVKVSLAPLYYPDTLVNPDTCLGNNFQTL